MDTRKCLMLNTSATSHTVHLVLQSLPSSQSVGIICKCLQVGVLDTKNITIMYANWYAVLAYWILMEVTNTLNFGIQWDTDK